MTDQLSPAAQAVLDAFNDRYELCGPLEDTWHEVSLAAALCAAADAVAPAAAPHRRKIRAELLAIAAELEGVNV